MPSQLTWVGKNELANSVEARRLRANSVLLQLAQYHAADGENMMKSEASWTDRTAQARAGLFGIAEPTGTGARIMLGGTVHYQPYLELGTYKMRPRAIIVPVTNRVFGNIIADLGQLIA